MSIFLRRISIKGRYPFVRIFQILDNPKCFISWVLKNIYYKHSKIDYSEKYAEFHYLDYNETLAELIDSGMSLARFNDGEFDQLAGFGIYPPDSDWSQKNSSKLIKAMTSVLTTEDPRLLIAINPPHYFLSDKNSKLDEPFDYNMWVYTKTFLYKFLNKSKRYGDCRLFVPFCSPNFDWKKLTGHLRGKTVIVATGDANKLSNITLGQTNFFVECGKVDAFERLDTIKNDIRNVILSNNLDVSNVIVLASLGPAAGILAFDFLDENITVWDTGHMFKHAKNYVK
ncbi:MULTISPECIES: GT-D fold domain-containing glycosyltransferase [Vibrio]|uniref:GT-D fold domain-containing glycosyltransferase n=1 Tax=Vibrio TaxID=662 RepID=UPI0022AEC3C6|nr:GT-D fold domain-containing glycosyltransferase [Vibrio atlanticus]MCZ4310103.1 GT-D fold domain-containing glycosyltransferase [Vibrio atlanticus]